MSPGRDLNHHLQFLLTGAMAPSTATTYATGIMRYQGFCHAFKLIPVPGTKDSPPEETRPFDAQSGPYPWLLWFLEGQ